MRVQYLLGGCAMALVAAGMTPAVAQTTPPGVTYDDGQVMPAPGSGITQQENANENAASELNAPSGLVKDVEDGPGSVIKRQNIEADDTGTEGEAPN